MNLAANATNTEIIWVAVGLVALTINAMLWLVALRDLRAVHDAKQNGAKRIEALTWFWAHLILVLGQLDAVGIGMFLVFTPPVNPATPQTTTGTIIAAALIFKQLLNVLFGVVLSLRRGKLDAYLEGEQEATLSTARHEELMAVLTHQTSVGEAGLEVGEEGLIAASDAKVEATEAAHEAAEAKEEAALAHAKSQESIDLIIEATRQDGLTPAQLPPGVALTVAPTGGEPLRVTVVPDPENPVPVDVVEKSEKGARQE